MEASVASLVSQLGGATVLDRERAESRLLQTLKDPARQVEFKETSAEWRLRLNSDAWEQRLGALTAIKIALQHLQETSLAMQAVHDSLSLLIDSEVRVRLAVGDCLREAAKILGARVWEVAAQPILDNIKACWDRDALLTEGLGGEVEEEGAPLSGDFVTDLLQSSYNRQKPGTGEMRHGTEGWQALETSFVALRRIVAGSGDSFQPHHTPELRELLYKACRHPNRFIRETTYHILAALCCVSRGHPLREFGGSLASCLQDGLSENWSQVRYAACVCARSFLQAAEGFEADYFPAILPHLCFNRYDVAEGVRFYSLDTWKLIMKASGPMQVAKNIDQVVAYYVRCAKTNNHTVREAACNCLAELFVKIERAVVEPHLAKIQRTLFRCLKDDSWTVRDAAASAYAKAALAFPEASQPAVAEVWPLWLGLLDDNVFSVRQHAAAALADVARAYGRDTIQQLLSIVRERLLRAKEQPPESVGSPFGNAEKPTDDLESGQIPNPRRSVSVSGKRMAAESKMTESWQPATHPTVPGELSEHLKSQSSEVQNQRRSFAPLDVNGASVSERGAESCGLPSVASPRRERAKPAKAPREEDALFKEGSLLRAKPKDTGGIDYSCGCMDYSFRRDKEPWEAADGAVYLLAELAEVAPADVPALFPVLAEVALLDHWPQARSLQTTICRQLPEIMTRLGKRAFKQHIELFLDPLFRCLSCENQLCRAAAGACLGAFRDSLGPRIFAGRLDAQQQAAMASSADVPPPTGAFATVDLQQVQSAGTAPWLKTPVSGV